MKRPGEVGLEGRVGSPHEKGRNEAYFNELLSSFPLNLSLSPLERGCADVNYRPLLLRITHSQVVKRPGLSREGLARGSANQQPSSSPCSCTC